MAWCQKGNWWAGEPRRFKVCRPNECSTNVQLVGSTLGILRRCNCWFHCFQYTATVTAAPKMLPSLLFLPPLPMLLSHCCCCCHSYIFALLPPLLLLLLAPPPPQGFMNDIHLARYHALTRSLSMSASSRRGATA